MDQPSARHPTQDGATRWKRYPLCREHLMALSRLTPDPVSARLMELHALRVCVSHFGVHHGFAGQWDSLLGTLARVSRGCPLCLCCDPEAALLATAHLCERTTAALEPGLCVVPDDGVLTPFFHGDGRLSCYARLAVEHEVGVLAAYLTNGFN
jgi:hypothetical protein